MSSVRRYINDEGVSPIVATLVLIVVAIIGAAAVALIMGSFSSNVSNQASAGNNAGSSSTVINVADNMQGSFEDQIPKWFAANNTGITVNTVFCSDPAAALSALEVGGADIVAIGCSPDKQYSADVAQYNLKTYQIGESAMVFVTKPGAGVATISKSQLVAAYTTGNIANVHFDGAVNGDHAGPQATEIIYLNKPTNERDGASAYLGTTSAAVEALPGITKVQLGNIPDEVNSPGSGAYPIAIMDASIAFARPVTVLSIYDDSTGTAYGSTLSDIQNEIMNYHAGGRDPATYPAALIRPEVLVTKGNPSALELAFIKYVQSPIHQVTLTDEFLVHVSQVGSYFLLAPAGT